MSRRGPPRLRDDPEFARAFADIDAVIDGRDLERLRPIPVVARFAGGSVVAIAAVLLLLLGWSTLVHAPIQQAAVAPIGGPSERPVPVPVPAPESAGPPADESVVAVAAAPSTPHAAPVPANPPPLDGGSADEEPLGSTADPTTSAEDAGTGDLVRDEPVDLRGDLDAELAGYDAAKEALDAGRPEDAVTLVERYHAAWPDGRLDAQADMVWLHAAVELRDWATADALAARLVDRPEVASRRHEVLALRGRALAESGRCPEALAIAEALPRRDALGIRGLCR